jgi:IS1 family transposase
MKPKSEKDCPHCQNKQEKHDPQPGDPPAWDTTKGKGGRPKRICTQWHFCTNPDCPYYLVADERVHALVGYGHHGKYENIQDFKCQACGKKFTSRRNTLTYRLKTHSQTVRLIMELAALGTDISSLEQAFNKRESAIRIWLTRAGNFGKKLHNRFFINLNPKHIQLDELWADVKRAGKETWVWTAVDAKTKIIAVLKIGERNLLTSYSVAHELKSRLLPGCVPVFSTDGLKNYFYVLTPHFGEWHTEPGEKKPQWLLHPDFLYAQVIKRLRGFRLVGVEHRLIWGTPQEYLERLKADGLSGCINTAFVERLNLTIRRSISKLMRRTWSTAQSIPALEAHAYWWMAYYHFARNHESLRVKLAEPIARKGQQTPRRYRKATPAMAAGITSRQWSVMELIHFPLP